MKPGPIALLTKWNAALMAAMLPYGSWGIGALAVIDSSTIPVPIDALLIDFVVHDHAKFILYCFMAALGSAIGSLLPFYLGKAGGELFLMKRINRKRYEQLRDRFERQEFLAIMIPAMMPPPMPVKVFEFAAGVFEMKTLWFFMAILIGKFFRFLAEALVTVYFGRTILDTISHQVRAHMAWLLGIGGIFGFVLVLWIMRKIFDRKKGAPLPIEDVLEPEE